MRTATSSQRLVNSFVPTPHKRERKHANRWLELIAVAKLKQSPSPFKSVIRPFFHKVAWNSLSSAVKAPPTASPLLLSQSGTEDVPPSVPKSWRIPWSHKKVCTAQPEGPLQPTSPFRFEYP